MAKPKEMKYEEAVERNLSSLARLLSNQRFVNAGFLYRKPLKTITVDEVAMRVGIRENDTDNRNIVAALLARVRKGV